MWGRPYHAGGEGPRKEDAGLLVKADTEGKFTK